MTGQVTFDSHILSVLEVTARLVNGLTPGHDGGRPVTAPSEDELVYPVAEALAQDGRRPAVTRTDAEVLRRVALRARVVFDAVARHDIDTAAAEVNRLLEATATRPRLDHQEGEGWSVHFHGSDDTLGPGWSAGCAAGLALALGSDLAGRLGVCDAPECDRVYVDTSKNGTRRFCSSRCQSRVKAAAHRARQASRG